MRAILTLVGFLGLVCSSQAFDLGIQAPAKPAGGQAVHIPAGWRQGGDTVADAVPITPPGTWTGTTVGYNNDFGFMCPFGGMAADVVYSVSLEVTTVLDIDLCYSSYDTQLYVCDESLSMLACSDDFHFGPPCGVYTSRIEGLILPGGATYYIIIDGYVNSEGAYEMDITDHAPCEIACPAGAQLENEPPIQDGYVDSYNSGCGNLGTPVFQTIAAPVFCGKGGWYLGQGGAQYRDTDWFHITMPAGGVLEITGDAEFATYLFELGPQDCNLVDVVQYVTVGPCQPNSLTITGEPGSLVWFWVGSTTYSGPVNEYNYLLLLNLEEPVAAAAATWSSVRALFR